MSLIIENGKVIKATGDANQIIADFNEYLEFVRETTIPVPKNQFTNLSENHAKLYNDHMEAIKECESLQKEIKSSRHIQMIQAESIENARVTIEKNKAEIEKLNSKLNELQKAYDEVCLKWEQAMETKFSPNNSEQLGDEYDNIQCCALIKDGDIAFIIERSCADPTDESTTVAHVTLACYTGRLWHSLDMHVIETDFAEIVPIHNAEYLKEYFGREDIISAVKFHY